MTRSGQAAQRRGVFLALLALGSAPAAAIELEDGKLSLNGFGSWAYGARTGTTSWSRATPATSTPAISPSR
jgi:hypothetical protein